MTIPSPATPATAPLSYFVDYEPPTDDFLADAQAGLAASPKALSPKYFYDETGSRLFDDICRTEEYYVTRTEMALLDTVAPEVARIVGPGAIVIEYGSGSSWKIRKLLDALEHPAEYVALDISRDHLIGAAGAIAHDYPDLRVGAVCADFTEPLTLPPEAAIGGGHRLGFLPGSTIGNFAPARAERFLRAALDELSPKGGVLIGVDLKKDEARLNAAYNDRKGVTAAFNLNLLSRMQRELAADVNPEDFEHVAFYNDALGRVEMHLKSRRAQTVHIGGKSFDFAAGETLHTENSYKYTIEEFQSLARRAGFHPARVWTDPEKLFSVHYLDVQP
jgi:dimethylhistidine N-methyltransferase